MFNDYTQPTLELHGERGSGKTSLIYRVYQVTRTNLPNNTWKTMWFDAWEYERIDTSNLITTEICYIRCMLKEYNYFGKTKIAGGNYLFLIYFSQKLSPKFLVCLST